MTNRIDMDGVTVTVTTDDGDVIVAMSFDDYPHRVRLVMTPDEASALSGALLVAEDEARADVPVEVKA